MSNDPFPGERPPLSDHEILRDLWYAMGEVKAQVIRTNGRVSSLEKFRYAAVGGLAVVMAVVVPLFIRAVSQ